MTIVIGMINVLPFENRITIWRFGKQIQTIIHNIKTYKINTTLNSHVDTRTRQWYLKVKIYIIVNEEIKFQYYLVLQYSTNVYSLTLN